MIFGPLRIESGFHDVFFFLDGDYVSADFNSLQLDNGIGFIYRVNQKSNLQKLLTLSWPALSLYNQVLPSNRPLICTHAYQIWGVHIEI